jgi:hypothetical protein
MGFFEQHTDGLVNFRMTGHPVDIGSVGICAQPLSEFSAVSGKAYPEDLVL